jgi:predicted transcriptional regulator
MQLTIQIDDEYARQLALIQKQTNQDPSKVIQQGISLYYQQLQPHYQVRVEIDREYDLVCNVSANTN